MNEPHNKDNFLVEITPEVMTELNDLYRHADADPVAELHYSPYWKEMRLRELMQPAGENDESNSDQD